MLREFQLNLRRTAFPLHPETPEDGVTLEELFRGRNFNWRAANDRMKALMAQEGLLYESRQKTFNSRLAQELGKFGEQQGKPQIHDALYKAYFVNGLNLARTEVLIGVAESVGLSPEVATAVLTERPMRDAVDADWKRSRDLGVTGVPTFVVGNSMLVGAQPYETLEQFVRSAGAISCSAMQGGRGV